ncbi:MAG: ABC transporter permease [Bacilli bacterium]|nr:ABC transporter permease [Bacilli bacterium]
MGNILSLTKRNLLLFFRNKSEVFFSFLSVIIILGLYVLFLSDLQVTNIKDAAGEIDGVKALVNSWVMAGLIAVSTVTIALGVLGRMVMDKYNGVMNDFLVAPIKRKQIFLSYILSTLIVTLLISFLLIIIAEVYILSSGGVLLNIIQLLQIIGITLLCTISSSLVMLFIVSFLKSNQTYSLICTIVGTMIGFITGAYIPVGIMPKFLQVISNLVPVSQGAALYRKIFLDVPLKEVFGSSPKLMTEYTNMQGVNLYLGDHELTTTFMILYIIGIIVIFAILNMIRFNRMKNK